jgi:DNA-binding transcriptional MerR regulator
MATSKRELFKAPEVCEMAQLQPYVLRTWESEFPALGQTASSGGVRVYRRTDVELVLRIKQLVFVEGLTLAGARRRLEEQQDEPSVASVAVDDVLDGMARSRLRQVRTGLEAIMRLLDKDQARRDVPELQLVPPPASRGGSRAVAKRAAVPEKRATVPARRSPKPVKSAKRKRAS